MEAVVVPVTATAFSVSGLVRAVVAATEAEERTGSWLPWLAGFLPGALVVLAAYLVLRHVRRGR